MELWENIRLTQVQRHSTKPLNWQGQGQGQGQGQEKERKEKRKKEKTKKLSQARGD